MGWVEADGKARRWACRGGFRTVFAAGSARGFGLGWRADGRFWVGWGEMGVGRFLGVKSGFSRENSDIFRIPFGYPNIVCC